MATNFPNLPDEYHLAISNVTTRSAQLDYHIENVIDLALRDQPKIAEFALKNLGSDRAVGFMENALRDAFPDEQEPIDNLMLHINTARRERNEVTHWLWGHMEVDGKAPLMKKRPFREIELKEMSAADIRRVAEDIHVAVKALLEWQNSLGARLRETSRGKPWQQSPQTSLAWKLDARPPCRRQGFRPQYLPPQH